MDTEITDNVVQPSGWLFYDGDCRFCRESVRRVERILARRRFHLCTLQSPEAAQRLGLSGSDLLREMQLLLADGRRLGGADAMVEIARHIWWAWPLWLVNMVPGTKTLLRAAYRYIAARRHCSAGKCMIDHRRLPRKQSDSRTNPTGPH